VRGTSASGDDVAWDPPNNSIDLVRLQSLGPFDAVVNLCGAGVADKRWNEARKLELLSSRVVPTRLLAATLLQLDPVPPVLVNASAIGFYGEGSHLTEESAPGHGTLASLCQSWEAAPSVAEEAGVRVARLRTGIVLTTGGGALAKQLPIFRLGLGGPLGGGRQLMSWITLEDEVAAILAVIESDLEGPVNLTTPTPVTNAAFAKALGRALHRPAVVRVPRFALSLALGSELVGELLANQGVLPTRLATIGFQFAHPDLQSALGWLFGS
jgi:uncharacterized protein (TIGR01777 family)